MKTKKWYALEVREGGETETCYWKGIDAAHAEERFWEAFAEGGAQGIEVLSVTRHLSARRKNPPVKTQFTGGFALFPSDLAGPQSRSQYRLEREKIVCKSFFHKSPILP